MKKENIKVFVICLLLTIVFIRPVAVSAYAVGTVTDLQLISALDAFKNRIETAEPFLTNWQNKQKYYTVVYNGESYSIYVSIDPLVMYPPQTPGNLWTTPRFSTSTSTNYAYMNVTSSATYTLPTTYWNGTCEPTYLIPSNNQHIKYTSYPILTQDNIYIRSAVPMGYYYPTTYQQGTEYDSTIPVPFNLRVKHILPKGLFPAVRETQIETTWTPATEIFNLEISLMYTYKDGTNKITKLLPYVKHSDNYLSSLGTHLVKLETDILAYIHTKNPDTVGMTYSNGKLSVVGYYVRYTKSVNDVIKYGNWIKVDFSTGVANELDNGIITSKYDEVYTNEDGDEIVVTDSDYTGKYYNNNGESVDPTSLHSFTDYLLAIPNILAKTFDALMSLVGGLGTFGTVVGAFFVGMPLPLLGMVVGGFGFILIVVIIKVLK